MSILVLLWLLPSLLAAALLLVATLTSAQKAARVLAEASAGLLIAGLPFIITTPFTPVTKTLLVIVQIVALLLPARIIFGRLEKHFVYRSTQLGTILYAVITTGAVAVYSLGVMYPGILGTYDQRLIIILIVSLLAATYLLYGYMRAIRHYKLVTPSERLPLKDLPTVSVCIPARNETHALQECLASVIASDYPKLEILVLDDCSHDNTSRIIKSFAHDGVRFIKGDMPADGWLGKNQAMQTLAMQANGDYILFMDVDTRLSATTITDLVAFAAANKLEMLTVLPQNRLGWQTGALFTPLRNFWQMALPPTRRNMPVASQCWLVREKALRSLGGFASVSRKIVPEESFAARLSASRTYRFIVGNSGLGVTTAKHWSSLYESSARILYPTYKRQPVFALAVVAGILLFGLLPFAVLIWKLAHGAEHSLVLATSILACAALILTYALVISKTHPRTWPLAMLFLPVVLLQEIIFIIASMLKYEFGQVNWKGRNICYDVIAPSGPGALARQVPLPHQR